MLNELTRVDMYVRGNLTEQRLRSPECTYASRTIPRRPGASLSTILLIYEYYPLLRVALGVGARVIKRGGRVCVIADVRPRARSLVSPGHEEEKGEEREKWQRWKRRGLDSWKSFLLDLRP